MSMCLERQRWEECLLAIFYTIEKKIELNIYEDSHLIINQVNDEYQTKDDIFLSCKRMADEFK